MGSGLIRVGLLGRRCALGWGCDVYLFVFVTGLSGSESDKVG